MKKLIFLILFVSVCTCAFGQKKRVQHNVTLGGGIKWETEGLVKPIQGSLTADFDLSYGLDIRLGGGWSVMPGAEASVSVSKQSWGGTILPFAELSLLGRYHAQIAGREVVFGLGPDIQFISWDKTYDDYTEGWSGWRFVVPRQLDIYQWGLKTQVHFFLTDFWFCGLEFDMGFKQLYLPANLYHHTVRLSTGFRF